MTEQHQQPDVSFLQVLSSLLSADNATRNAAEGVYQGVLASEPETAITQLALCLLASSASREPAGAEPVQSLAAVLLARVARSGATGGGRHWTLAAAADPVQQLVRHATLYRTAPAQHPQASAGLRSGSYVRLRSVHAAVAVERATRSSCGAWPELLYLIRTLVAQPPGGDDCWIGLSLLRALVEATTDAQNVSTLGGGLPDDLPQGVSPLEALELFRSAMSSSPLPRLAAEGVRGASAVLRLLPPPHAEVVATRTRIFCLSNENVPPMAEFVDVIRRALTPSAMTDEDSARTVLSSMLALFESRSEIFMVSLGSGLGDGGSGSGSLPLLGAYATALADIAAPSADFEDATKKLCIEALTSATAATAPFVREDPSLLQQLSPAFTILLSLLECVDDDETSIAEWAVAGLEGGVEGQGLGGDGDSDAAEFADLDTSGADELAGAAAEAILQVASSLGGEAALHVFSPRLQRCLGGGIEWREQRLGLLLLVLLSDACPEECEALLPHVVPLVARLATVGSSAALHPRTRFAALYALEHLIDEFGSGETDDEDGEVDAVAPGSPSFYDAYAPVILPAIASNILPSPHSQEAFPVIFVAAANVLKSFMEGCSPPRDGEADASQGIGIRAHLCNTPEALSSLLSPCYSLLVAAGDHLVAPAWNAVAAAAISAVGYVASAIGPFFLRFYANFSPIAMAFYAGGQGGSADARRGAALIAAAQFGEAIGWDTFASSSTAGTMGSQSDAEQLLRVVAALIDKCNPFELCGTLRSNALEASLIIAAAADKASTQAPYFQPFISQVMGSLCAALVSNDIELLQDGNGGNVPSTSIEPHELARGTFVGSWREGPFQCIELNLPWRHHAARVVVGLNISHISSKESALRVVLSLVNCLGPDRIAPFLTLESPALVNTAMQLLDYRFSDTLRLVASLLVVKLLESSLALYNQYDQQQGSLNFGAAAQRLFEMASGGFLGMALSVQSEMVGTEASSAGKQRLLSVAYDSLKDCIELVVAAKADSASTPVINLPREMVEGVLKNMWEEVARCITSRRHRRTRRIEPIEGEDDEESEVLEWEENRLGNIITVTAMLLRVFGAAAVGASAGEGGIPSFSGPVAHILPVASSLLQGGKEDDAQFQCHGFAVLGYLLQHCGEHGLAAAAATMLDAISAGGASNKSLAAVLRWFARALVSRRSQQQQQQQQKANAEDAGGAEEECGIYFLNNEIYGIFVEHGGLRALLAATADLQRQHHSATQESSQHPLPPPVPFLQSAWALLTLAETEVLSGLDLV